MRSPTYQGHPSPQACGFSRTSENADEQRIVVYPLGTPRDLIYPSAFFPRTV